MSPRPVRGIVASVALHIVLVAAVLTALPRSELLPALFIDLTIAALSDGPDASAVSPPAAPRATTRPRPAPSPAPSDGASSRSQPAPSAMPEPAAPIPVSPPPAPAVPSPPEAPSPQVTPPPPVASPLPVAPPPAVSPPPVTPPPPATPPLAVAPAPITPSPASAPPASSPEPEVPSASAALNDGPGATSGESSPAPVSRASVPAEAGQPTPSGRERPATPTARDAPASQGGAGGAGAGQELARRSPGSESSEAPQALYNAYLARLRQRVHEALRYPPTARRRGLTGSVTVELTIAPSGAIRDVAVVESSSHPLLDQAALDTLRELRAQPFPAGVPPRTLKVRLPVVFQLE